MNAPFRPITVAPEPTVLDSALRYVTTLPDRQKVEMIRHIASELSWCARGHEKIDAGCDCIINDLDDEQIAIDCGGVLPDDAWNYARMEDTFSAPLNQITGRVA